MQFDALLLLKFKLFLLVEDLRGNGIECQRDEELILKKHKENAREKS